MKKILIGGLLALLPTFSFAQMKVENSYSYKVSEPYKECDAENKLYISKGNQSLAIKIEKLNILIQRFDNSKTFLIGQKLYEKVLPKNRVFEAIYEFNDKIQA